jgi:transposase
VSAPTYEELAALVVALQARIAAQDAEIEELERQLAASSRNSSRPPSSDGLGKPAPKSLRGRSGRTLRQVAVPDEVVTHEPGACAGESAHTYPPRPKHGRRPFDALTELTIGIVWIPAAS